MQEKKSFWEKYQAPITVIGGLLGILVSLVILSKEFRNFIGWPGAEAPAAQVVHELRAREGTGSGARRPTSRAKAPPGTDKAEKATPHPGIRPETYINTAIIRTGHPAKVAILVWQASGESLTNVETALAHQVIKHGLQPVQSFFSPAFVRDGRAQLLLGGDWTQANTLGLRTHVDYVLLGFAKTKYAADPDFKGLLTANLKLELKCLDVVHQTICGSQRYDTQGAGYTNDAALGVAVDHMRSDLQSFVGKAF
jgi:hypothetical protein